METNQIIFQINITGDANNVVNQLSKNIQNLSVTSNKMVNVMIEKFGILSLLFNQMSLSLQGVENILKGINEPAVKFDKSLQELSAITGVTGKGLNEIGNMAQDVAKKFGTDAAEGVESFKLLLSQLSPELGKTPEVMKKMGEDIAILSKTMGGDTTAAAEVLTTAMNQYGVSMEDPIEAEREMARMMNVMAAAAKEGSAELPQIQEALKQSGMAAKTAGVSFEETNAAIQVLDKAGRKGSEGGVALRNVMTTLAAGRFLPKDVQQELQSAGINVGILTDRSKSLQERLQVLKPIMEDQALLTKLFGRENVSSAIALIGGTQALQEYTQAISGTNTATEQADIIMQSYEERHKGLKLKMFDMTNGMTMYVQTFIEMIVPLAQTIPLFTGIYKAFVMVITGIKGIVLSVRVAIVSFGGLAGAARVACASIGAAIKSIPVIGWIIAIVAAIGGLIAYFWNTSAKFRAIVKGSWAYVVSITKEAWGVIKKIFVSIAEAIEGVITFNPKKVLKATKGIVGAFKDFGKQSAKAYKDAYDKEIEKSKKEEKKEKVEVPDIATGVTEANKDIGGSSASASLSAGSIASGGGNSSSTNKTDNRNT